MERFSVLADVNLFFVFISLCKHFWVLQCIFIVKLPSTYSLEKKMYSLVSNNSRLTHPLARVFLKFVILSPTKGIYVVCFDYVSKNGNFSVCFAFFTGLLLSILYKQLPPCFQLFDHYRLLFPLIFNNLLKNLKIRFQHLDVLLISSRPTVYYSSPLSLKFKPNSSPYVHDYSNTVLL